MTNWLLRRAVQALMHPEPYRVRLLRPLLARMRWIPYDLRLQFDAMPRPYYGYCVWHAARLAQRLGLEQITAIEFGVAGGNGLLILEQHAMEVTEATGVVVHVAGFDTGSGLPTPKDYRDMPCVWQDGFYRMDYAALNARLSLSRLFLGDVGDQIHVFAETNMPPIGAIVFDLDFYSSTLAALRVFDLPQKKRLPRVFCHFDDIIYADPIAGINRFTGQSLAIAEYNAEHERRKLARDSALSIPRKCRAQWCNQIYLHHDFDHPSYAAFVGSHNDQRPLLKG